MKKFLSDFYSDEYGRVRPEVLLLIIIILIIIISIGKKYLLEWLESQVVYFKEPMQ